MQNNSLRFLFSSFALLNCFVACTPSPSEQKDDLANVSFVSNAKSVKQGKTIFNRYCAACHSFRQGGIGPNLSGVTGKASKTWLASFIRNAPEMIKSGDERALALYSKHKNDMPAFTMLTEEQIEHILGYMHTFSEDKQSNTYYRPGGTSNPIEDTISASNLWLVLEEVLTLPASDTVPPLARINKLLAVEGANGERLFIHDMRGKLYEITDRSPTTYLDIQTTHPDFIHVPGFGTGFGSFAFHPDFKENGLLYTTHTEPANAAPADFSLPDSLRASLQWVLVEWKADNPQAKQFSGTRREVLRVDMTGYFHGFQEVAFNPLARPGDTEYGLLYLGIGDGGSAMEYPFLSSSRELIWGSVIRIDPAGTNSENAQYGIPEDNPFVDDPTAVHEIWARGFRNPHRISWDETRSGKTGSGKMFITNIGKHSVEEVNLGVAGADYGWPRREGMLLFDPLADPALAYPLPEDDTGFTYPVVQYDHDDGRAISGGFVYAGKELPLLQGKYIFGDIPLGKVFYAEVEQMELGQQAPVYQLGIEFNGEPTDLRNITQHKRVDLRLGLDAAGELYLFAKSNGTLYKVVEAKRLTL